MPAAVPIIAAVITVAGTAVEANQQKQAAKGAANAASDQQKQVAQATADQQKKDQANLNQQGNNAGASQKAALDAIRASMTTGQASGGTILTGPQGSSGTPAQGKTLLGV